MRMIIANDSVIEGSLPICCARNFDVELHCSPKDYYDAAKLNDDTRKIMQIPLFLGAIAIFYVSDEGSPHSTAFASTLTTPGIPLYTPEQRQRQDRHT